MNAEKTKLTLFGQWRLVDAFQLDDEHTEAIRNAAPHDGDDEHACADYPALRILGEDAPHHVQPVEETRPEHFEHVRDRHDA